MREKAITRLVELAAGPEPESEKEETTVANAEAAALASNEETVDIPSEQDNSQLSSVGSETGVAETIEQPSQAGQPPVQA